MRILDLTESEQQVVYRACEMIESVLEKHGELYLDTFLEDKKHRSIIHLSYHNNRKIEDETHSQTS